MKIILITGAAGSIGNSLRQHLGQHYHFRCLDIKPITDADDAVVADITNFEAVLEAMQEVDAVIHLAANPSVNQAWHDVYTSGIAGAYNVFEAARQAGVSKIIYASSTHVSIWPDIKQEVVSTPEMTVHPDSLYGVGKACGEILGRFYTEKYNLSVICLRIGSFQLNPQPNSADAPILRTWCSPRDLAQLVRRSLDTNNLGFQIFYAVSGNRRSFWDISNAQKLVGYQPEDDAEQLLPKS
ncbi:MAG: NAD(P)-dependent oxidoreductase [Aphanothece sp. CMT-3BRIN-NPC111]|jgi:uronate dehydrogenase|nr:NAD(P)-dependent oxidoreductase [Aphanothece sp. CMT-3BRIN-NPC111]